MNRWLIILALSLTSPLRAQFSSADKQADLEQLAPLPSSAPAPADNPTSPDKVELGKMLFFEPRLSGKQPDELRDVSPT